jgi:hypothetical protein
LTLLARSQPARAAKCEECEKAAATVSCGTCNTVLCSPCFDGLHKSKTMSKHVKAPLGERSRDSEPMCSEHKQPSLLYCIGCKASNFLESAFFTRCMHVQVVICLLCRDYGDHKGHNIDLVKNLVAKMRTDIQDSVTHANKLNHVLQAEAASAMKGMAGARAELYHLVCIYFECLQIARWQPSPLAPRLKSKRPRLLQLRRPGRARCWTKLPCERSRPSLSSKTAAS